MEGRGTGTEGSARARRFLVAELARRGLDPVDGRFEHPFVFRAAGDEVEAVNLLGLVRGTRRPDEFIVVTAHYDHLGIRDGVIYNGADDNASGAAALLALASRFVAEPPGRSILFAWLDAEELGLRGARELVADPPVPLPAILLDVNLDMVGRSDAGELYAAGTHHSPFLVPLVEEVARTSPVRLLLGHDTPDLPSHDDWTLASDHGPFHEAGIPFVYFGVEDHAGYHAPTDDVEAITPGFFVDSVETILDFLRLVDQRADAIREDSGRARP
jgi:Zn-dependent M28 family amino/carboxypeptidase